MKKRQDNPWTIKDADVKYENPWIKVQEYDVLNPGGGKGIYGVVEIKNLAVGMIPLSKNMDTWLVRQYRFPLNEWTYEIPEGGCPPSSTPLETAKRELEEETGITASKWTPILEVQTSNCITNELGYVYLAEDLSIGDANPDEDEYLELIKLPIQEALQWVENGKIKDALSVAGLLSLARRLGI